jgi:alpha-L-fucosidase 2
VLISLALSALLLAAAPPPAPAQKPAPSATPASVLRYDRPASEWLTALPVGNGHLGAMVFGRVADERIPLNDDTLWDGYAHDTTNPEALQYLPEVRRLVFAGKYEEAMDVAGKHFMSRPARIKPYQPLADLWIETPPHHRMQDYGRELDLATGIARVTYRAGDAVYTREVFASAPDDVIVVRLAADQPGRVAARVRLSRFQDAHVELGEDGHGLLLQGQITRVEEGTGANRGLRFAACLRAVAEGGKLAGSGDAVRVDDANAVTLIIAGATSFRGKEPVAACRARLAAAAGKSFAALRAAHVKDHEAIAGRMTLDLGPAANPDATVDQRLAALRRGGNDPALMALHFAMGRYLLMGSSRPGNLPANLQGLWNEHLAPAWNADYHLNINLQMNYWPAEVTALGDLAGPFFDYVESLVPSGRKTAQVHYGARGWVAHHLSDIWGFTTPADGAVGVWPMGAAWLAQHFWEHYLFTGDRAFLARRAYPLMKEAATFLLDYLVADPQGRLVTNPSHSPENVFIAKDGTKSKFTYGSTMDLEIVNDLFTSTSAAAERLGVDQPFRATLAAALARLAPLQVSPSGRLQEWIEDFKEVDPGHRHISHLFAVYPGRQITLRGTPALAAAARKSLEFRLANGGGKTGWSRAWIAAMWARFEDGDRAYESLKALLAENTSDGLLDLHPPRIFQIDGNEGATAAMAEMLLQSHTGDVHLLPALPRAWPEGRARGLRARGGHTVDVAWKAGALTEARLAPTITGPCRVRSAKPLEVWLDGRPVTVTRPEPTVAAFPATAGKSYLLRPRP